MRLLPKNILKTISITAMLLLTTQASQADSAEKIAKLKLLITAYDCGLYSEKIAKDYLYAGNKVAIRQASRESKTSLISFQVSLKHLNESTNDPKSKNLLTFIQMSFDELETLIKEPYSLDNAQIVLDLSATILEGSSFIATQFREPLHIKDKYTAKGARIYFESIAKYYMAYQAGIRDDNTIRLMQETVKKAGTTIEAFVSYPDNTVAMNQNINKAKRLWQIVHKFYLDIDKGGLPFIVYKTSEDLNRYVNLYIKEKVDLMKEKGFK